MEKSFDERYAEAKAAVSSVSPREANERKVNNPDTLFIDPRDAEDISGTGIIPGALNVPLNELSENSNSDLPQELSSHSRSRSNGRTRRPCTKTTWLQQRAFY